MFGSALSPVVPQAGSERDMGHIRLGRLPRTRQWLDVVDLLNVGAGVGEIAVATSKAADGGFSEAEVDPALIEAVWLLAQLPEAARQQEFTSRLRELGVAVNEQPTLLDLSGALAEAIERRLPDGPRGRTDIGEMAGLAAVETLTRVVGGKVESLFDSTPEDVQRALASLATEKQFAGLARAFFSRFAERYLAYYLSRELPVHIGSHPQLFTIDAHSSFNKALAQHCFEASRILEAYAGEWFSKARWQNDLTRSRTRTFARVALGKLRKELQLRNGGGDGR